MKFYVVGGAVRDEMLGREVKDVDWVVVGATPEQMTEQGYEQVGADFPVFLHPQTGEEYALARQERKTGPGYHGFETHYDPSVSLEDDLFRRDLTINAMAKDPETGEIIDPYGGRTDLKNGTLRHVSDAFAEDPVRVLRVARFTARYGFNVAPETMELMRNMVEEGELDHLTAERVWAELEKTIMEDYPNEFFWVLKDCGAFDVLFPEFGRSLLYSGWATKRASLRKAGRRTRLMILFSQTKWEDSQTLLERLKAPSDVKRGIRKFRTLLVAMQQEKHAPGVPGIWDIDAQGMLTLLKDIDAFRQEDDLYKMSSAMGHMHGERLTDRMDMLLEAFNAARNVTFATLPDEVKAGLKGPAVGRAIDEARTVKIQEVIT